MGWHAFVFTTPRDKSDILLVGWSFRVSAVEHLLTPCAHMCPISAYVRWCLSLACETWDYSNRFKPLNLQCFVFFRVRWRLMGEMSLVCLVRPYRVEATLSKGCLSLFGTVLLCSPSEAQGFDVFTSIYNYMYIIFSTDCATSLTCGLWPATSFYSQGHLSKLILILISCCCNYIHVTHIYIYITDI